MITETCTWCGGKFEKISGPTHEYIESIPGCWAVYGQILAKEYENFSDLGDIHRLTVDTYAVQHPGKPSRKSNQSVWGHLVSLYCLLELETSSDVAREMLKNFVEMKLELSWLEPPNFDKTLTVNDIISATTKEAHTAIVQKWAQSVWNAWYSLHTRELDAVLKKLNT